MRAPANELHVAPVNAAAAWLITLAEAAAIIFASVLGGLAYSQVALGYEGEITEFLGTGVLAAVLFSGVMRLREGRGLSLRRGFDAIADASFVWCGVFLFLALLAFLLKLSGDLSRGSATLFFLFGLVSVSAARAFAPRAIAALCHARQLAGDDVLLVGAAGDAAWKRSRPTSLPTGCASVTAITVDAACPEPVWRRELDDSLERNPGFRACRRVRADLRRGLRHSRTSALLRCSPVCSRSRAQSGSCPSPRSSASSACRCAPSAARAPSKFSARR